MNKEIVFATTSMQFCGHLPTTSFRHQISLWAVIDGRRSSAPCSLPASGWPHDRSTRCRRTKAPKSCWNKYWHLFAQVTAVTPSADPPRRLSHNLRDHTSTLNWDSQNDLTQRPDQTYVVGWNVESFERLRLSWSRKSKIFGRRQYLVVVLVTHVSDTHF